MIDPAVEQRVRDAFERWNRGDRSWDADWFHPDVEIHSAAADLSGNIYRGREGQEQWVREMGEAFDEWQLELHEISEPIPGRVFAVGAIHLRGRGSGATVDVPCAWLMDHVDGVMTRFEPFPNRVDEAREIVARG